MNKVYSRIEWKNFPSTDTALNALNLNKMDVALNEVDNRVISLDTTKVSTDDLTNNIKSWTMDESTGIITITKYDGSQILFDLNIEKIPVNFSLSNDGILTMETSDGTKFTANIGAMIPIITFNDSDTIAVSMSGEGVNKTYSFSIKNGSITSDKLQPDYLADITVQASNASKSAQDAKQSEDNAKLSETNAKESETNSKQSEDNAKESENNASTSAGNASTSAVNAATSEQNALTYKTTIEEYKSDIEGYKSVVETNKDIVVTKATEASNSATEAKTSEDNSKINELSSEGYAKGTQDGIEVTEGSPYYQNNSKYWAEQSRQHSDLGNGTITIKQNGEVAGTFTTNQSNDTEIDLVGEEITFDTELSLTSENGVQNKVITKALDDKASTDVATQIANGLMSKADKAKLDGIADQANKTEILDVLTSDKTTSALSANQGKILNDKLTGLGQITYDDTNKELTIPARFITYNATEKSLTISTI